MHSKIRTIAMLLAALAAGCGLRPAQAATVNLISMNGSWRYNQSGANLSGQFQAVGYDDGAWAVGGGVGPEGASGLFGLETSSPYPYPYPITTPLTVNGNKITYYFRAHFNMPADPTGWYLVMTNYVDDGAVIYVNGSEVARIRMPIYGNITSSTLGSLANPEGVAVLLAIPATNVVQGDNVIAVEVHQNSTTSSDIVFGLSLDATSSPPSFPPMPLPDLVLDGSLANPRLETKTWAAGDCEVLEGCGTPGTRRLLRFDTWTRNIGTADLVLGSPANNPLFVYDSCHNHYHFTGFADYRLVDLSNHVVAVGNKVGFCLEDLQRIDSSAPATAYYTCTYQGIQRGWADIYNSGLPCQYVDITGIPSGTYWLELEIDPDHKIPELNESNNIVRVSVEITAPCTAPPSNDNFDSPLFFSNSVATIRATSDCATKQGGEPSHAGNAGGRSIWFRWTASASGTTVLTTEGSSIDSLLAVYSGSTVNSLATIASNDDVGTGPLWSRVTFAATAGTTYQIAVDGYNDGSVNGAQAGFIALNLNPGANNAFAACLPIAGPVGTIGGINTSATREAGEPNHAGNPGGHSIWFCWTAPTNGPFTFDTVGSRFDTLLAVYTGSSVAALTPIASNDDSGTYSRVAFNAVAGVNYRIAIDGKDGATGIAVLNWRPTLRFTSVVRSGPLLQFDVAGAPGDHCVIETSPDCLSWQTWSRITNSTGLMSVSDPISAATARFYRVRAE